MKPGVNYREPDIDSEHYIIGKKDVYNVFSSGYEAEAFITWMENPVRNSTVAYTCGYNMARISTIEENDYDGIVYDVSVEGDDPSFCVPGIAVHNCGAGMVNVALLYQTMIGMSFSIENSGDWLDESAARATGSTASRVQSVKERGLNLLDPNDGDPKTLREREALIIYYKSLILRILDSIKSEFLKRQGSIDLPSAIPLILSGGTSMPKGFKQLFEEGFNSIKSTFPISISEIRMAQTPLNSVAQGLLVAAMNYGQ